MRADEAEKRLAGALAKDSYGRYVFACKNAIVTVRLRGESEPLRYGLHDRVVFRTAPHALAVEHLETGATSIQFRWEDLETLAAGEPETADGSLFQG
jgi:hypothetical protein